MFAPSEILGPKPIWFSEPARVSAPGPIPAPEPTAPRPPRRTSGFLAFLLFALGLAAGAWFFQRTSGPEVDRATGFSAGSVRTAVASRGALPDSIRLAGAVTAQQYAAIRAPQLSSSRRVPGGGGAGGGGLTLVKMVEPGSTVLAGAEVAEFDRQSMQLSIDSQQATVVQAGAMIQSQRARQMIEMETKRQEFVSAKAEFEKASLDLRTAEVRSQIEAEVLKNARDEAEATYLQLEKEVALLEEAHRAGLRTFEIDRDQEMIDLKRAEQNAEKMLVRTPIGGVAVVQTSFRGGSFAQAAEGDEIRPGTYFLQIVDPSSMVLEAQINQADSQRVRVGMKAIVRLDAYPDLSWKGRVASVAAMTGGSGDGRSRSGAGDFVRNITVTVEILENDARIIPDLSASADVITVEHSDMLLAPREALQRGEDASWFVQVREGAERFVRKAVELGPMNDTHVAITAGLNAGDELALEPVKVQ